MPPRRSARSTSGPVPPPVPVSKPSRSRKQPIPSTTAEDEEGFPGDSDDEEETIKPVVKKGKPVVRAAPAKKATRRSAPVVESDEDEAVEEKQDDEELGVKQDSGQEEDEDVPVKSKGRKPPAKPTKAVKAVSRGRKKVIASDSEEGTQKPLPTAGSSRSVNGEAAFGAVAQDVAGESVVPDTVEAEDEEDVGPSVEQVVEPEVEEDENAGVEQEGLKIKVDINKSDEGDGDLAFGKDRLGSDSSEADDLNTTPRQHTPIRPSNLLPPFNNNPPATPTPTFTPSRPKPSTPLPSTSQLPLPPPQPTGPKPRLTIHKLVLVNFKSYAGRQEIGPFHKSFSAIVGPNGSGKSNTIDALLFVFGYRASKMRQGKLSELIHNSEGREGLDNCSVEVWFREIIDLPGVDSFKMVPDSQLIVTRTAYRNNSSKYSINDRTSTFTEVTSLLKGKGIDLDHNRFLILQGEVESIAQMKAKAQNEHEDGLLEYLEDIIGTTKYKQPIEEASLEVEALNDQRGEKMNRLRVVEREKGALEEKKREAEDFLRDTNELTRKKSLLWQFHMHTLGNNLEITTKAIESLNGQLAEEQGRNAGHLAEIEDLQKGYQEKLAAFEEVKRLTDALVKDSKKFEKEEVGLSEKKKHLTTKQKKFKKSLADDGHARSEATANIDNLGSELETNRAKVDNLEKKLVTEEAELDEIRDSLKDKTDVFTSQIETKQRELEPWTTKISDKQSAIDVATSERDLLAQKATGAQSALEEAKASLKALKDGGGSKQEEYAALKKEGTAVKKQLQEGEGKLQSMDGRAEQIRSKLSASRHKADEAKASLAADKSENAVLSSLNKLKEQGRIKGFHGRLGDLGVIDDKYDVAVTTACGALNNLVVDTVEQGQACIEHLRKGNVGRASFMVLEKLPPRDLGPIETPENVPRLFDLIKPKDPRFAPAFYKGVFNTLVADDLVQAQRIGYGKKRWRVVTLAGQLIDPSGTMSGGGTKVQRGGMSSKLKADKVAPDVVARYDKEVGAAEEEMTGFLSERKEVEEGVRALRKRLPEIELGLEKIELDVQTSGKRIAEGEKRLAELRAQSKPDAADEKRIKVLDSEITTLTKEVDKLREKSSSISNEIKALQERILEVGGVKLRAVQSRVSNTKGLLDLANEAITKAEVGLAKSERDVEKLDKAIEGNKAKMEEVEGELKAVEVDLEGCRGDLEVIKGKVQEAVDASQDVKESLEESKKELDEKSEGINAFRALEMDIKQKIEDNGRIQKDSRDKLKHWRKRHDELELAFVDEEDEDEEEEASAEQPLVVKGEEGEEAEEVQKPGKKRKGNDSMELVEYSPDELRSVDKEMLNAEITQLEEDTARAKPNLNVLAEYRKREAEFLNRAQDMESVTNARDAAKKRYDDLRKVRLEEFMAGFSAISSKLKEMYQMITMGGNAEIELIDSMDPFSEGVVLSIMPPKKSWRAIANLSGGEKTLASLALVFALHVFKPTPLYFMDEIDAALDFKNVSIVANYIQSKTQAAQFIVISLRNDMFELAHRLVGIYKTSNCTKSIAIDNKDLRTQAVTRKKAPLNNASPEKQRLTQQLIPSTTRKHPPATPAMA